MADTKVSYVRIEPVKGGFILNYDERTKRPGSSEYDSYDYKSKKEIFSRKSIEKMMERVDELCEMCSDLTEVTFSDDEEDDD
jgi:hypothetical protein